MCKGTDMPNSVPRSSLVDAAAEIMREQIASRQWRVGERIPAESKLAEMLQVSRGTVRESVKTLAFAGLLEVRQGDGTYVRAASDPANTLRQLTRASLRDNFEVRCALEVEAARLAACRRGDEDVAHLYSLLDACSNEAEDGGKAAFVKRDLTFHLALVDAAHNPALAELYRWFSTVISDTIAATLEGNIPEPNIAAHRAIVDAIAAGDPDRAVSAVRCFMAPVLAALD